MMPAIKWVGLGIVIIGMFISQINITKVNRRIDIRKYKKYKKSLSNK